MRSEAGLPRTATLGILGGGQLGKMLAAEAGAFYTALLPTPCPGVRDRPEAAPSCCHGCRCHLSFRRG